MKTEVDPFLFYVCRETVRMMWSPMKIKGQETCDAKSPQLQSRLICASELFMSIFHIMWLVIRR